MSPTPITVTAAMLKERILVRSILEAHRYQFGHDTNCICGEPGIFDWDDWIAHVAPKLENLT